MNSQYHSRISRLEREIAGHDKTIGTLAKQEADSVAKINKAQSAMNKAASISTRNSKAREHERETKRLAETKKKQSDISTKRANATKTLRDYQKRQAGADESARKREAREQRKLMQERESHQRRMNQAATESSWRFEAQPQSDNTTDVLQLEEDPMADVAKQNPTAFVSYSWDNEEHKSWVRDLARRLRRDGIDVKLDQWETAPGDQLTAFMERGVREHDFVAIICTRKYKERSDSRAGGVGYEGDIMTAEVSREQNHRKFIPILRSGTWETAAPFWVEGKYYIDLRGNPYDQRAYHDLLLTLRGERSTAPPLGQRQTRDAEPARGTEPDRRKESEEAGGADPEEIRITGVIVDEVTEPTNDGRPGSALYTVPLRLSATPSSVWSQLFVRNWNSPPTWTPMHRPGIARVSGSKVLLEGTMIEEVEKVHRDTLQAVVSATNRDYGIYVADLERKRRSREEEREQHHRTVGDVAGRITFE